MDNYSSVHASKLHRFSSEMGDNKKKVRVAPISTKNIMKNSRHSSVDNDYCASADMRRQGVTSRDKNISLKNSCRSMCFAPQNQTKHL